jgi:hypothetical protein
VDLVGVKMFRKILGWAKSLFSDKDHIYALAFACFALSLPVNAVFLGNAYHYMQMEISVPFGDCSTPLLDLISKNGSVEITYRKKFFSETDIYEWDVDVWSNDLKYHTEKKDYNLCTALDSAWQDLDAYNAYLIQYPGKVEDN